MNYTAKLIMTIQQNLCLSSRQWLQRQEKKNIFEGKDVNLASLGLFFIIDWFTDLPTLLFGKLKKN